MDEIKNFLLSAEGACHGKTSGSLSGLENIIKLTIQGDATTGITLSGVILEIQRKHHHATGTLASDGDFTTATDTGGNAFNGTATAFTADSVSAHKEDHNIVIVGQQTPASTSGTTRRFAITLPLTSNIAAGSYTATVYYSEDLFASPTAVSHEDGGPEDGNHFGGGEVKVWSATSVPVTIAVAPSTTGATAGTTFDVTIASATYDPVTATAVGGTAQGTMTTSLTGTLTTNP